MIITLLLLTAICAYVVFYDLRANRHKAAIKKVLLTHHMAHVVTMEMSNKGYEWDNRGHWIAGGCSQLTRDVVNEISSDYDYRFMPQSKGAQWFCFACLVVALVCVVTLQ